MGMTNTNTLSVSDERLDNALESAKNMSIKGGLIFLCQINATDFECQRDYPRRGVLVAAYEFGKSVSRRFFDDI